MDRFKPINAKVSFLIFCTLLNFLPCSAQAFYQWEEDGQSLEASGLVRFLGMALQNPDNIFFYRHREVAHAGGFARFMLNAKWQEALSLEIHAEQSYIPHDLQTAGSRFSTSLSPERSDALAWSNLENQAQLQFDRFNLQYQSKNLTVKVGRQPLNLATTFFFTPNDFFSPFAAQTFYRAYKSGVDAARLDVQLGEFSQLSLISVLGYDLKANNDSGWRSKPNLDKTSYLGRLSSVIEHFQWALIGGRVRKNDIIGIDFQGEMFEWLGIRGEGHVNLTHPKNLANAVEFALSLEHRWENTFTLRLEQFYHGAGAKNPAAYLQNVLNQADRNSPYLGRLYTALGVSYEITPLLTGNLTFLSNNFDASGLVALYGNYSLSDESELALTVNLPFGKASKEFRVNSEFGLAPRLISLEYRCYF